MAADADVIREVMSMQVVLPAPEVMSMQAAIGENDVTGRGPPYYSSIG